MKKVYFKETQPFYLQPVIWLVMVLFISMVSYLYFNDLLIKWVAIVVVALALATLGFLFFIRLHTKITDTGIIYQMIPFHRAPRAIAWSDIETLEIIKYKPFREYGGYGIRIGMHGTTYNVKGNMGLRITIIDQKRHIMIGTQRPDEMREALQQASGGRYS